MEVNILAMLQTAMVVGGILCIGMLGLYAWLRHTGQIKGKNHRHDEQPQ